MGCVGRRVHFGTAGRLGASFLAAINAGELFESAKIRIERKTGKGRFVRPFAFQRTLVKEEEIALPSE